MIDIEIQQGEDLKIVNDDRFRIRNLLKTQIGDLVYNPGFGIDLKQFLQTDFNFSKETFESYLLTIFIRNNITSIKDIQSIDKLFFKEMNIEI